MMLFGTLTQTRRYHTHRVLKKSSLKKGDRNEAIAPVFSFISR